MASFTVRINDDDKVDLAAFDERARERDTNREELVRILMRQELARTEENYYTIKGYSSNHTMYADIRNLDGLVNWHSDGIEYKSIEWRRLKHAADLVERGEKGDKEDAIKMFQEIFGERQVFIKEE